MSTRAADPSAAALLSVPGRLSGAALSGCDAAFWGSLWCCRGCWGRVLVCLAIGSRGNALSQLGLSAEGVVFLELLAFQIRAVSN